MWKDDEERKKTMQINAKILLVIFMFCSTMLFVNIILSIKTEPGYIPEESEWDMPSNNEEEEDQIQPKSRMTSNQKEGGAGQVSKTNQQDQ